MSIRKIIRKYSLKDVLKYLDSIFILIKKEVQKSEYSEDVERDFIINTFSMTISMIAEKYNPQEVKDWVKCIIELIKKNFKKFNKSLLLADIYSLAIGYIAIKYKPQEKHEWVDYIFKSAENEKEKFEDDFIWWFNTEVLFYINQLSNISYICSSWYEYLIKKGVLNNALKTKRWDIIIPFIENAMKNIEDENLKEHVKKISLKILIEIQNETQDNS